MKYGWTGFPNGGSTNLARSKLAIVAGGVMGHEGLVGRGSGFGVTALIGI